MWGSSPWTRDPRWLAYAIRDLSDGNIVGTSNLNIKPERQCVEIGVTFLHPAIAKLGAVREGVMRRDRITWTGHVRDRVLFAITDLDWVDAQANLKSRLTALGWTEPTSL